MKDLLFLPGALGGSDQFESIKKNLEADFRVFLFDYSGHRNVPYKDHFSIELFAADLQAFILQNQIQKPIVLGYSMGGYVALRLCTLQTEMLGGIITLGTKLAWTSENAAKEVLHLNPEKMEEKVPEFAKALMYRHGQANWKKVLQETADMMLKLGAKNEIENYPLEQIKIPVWLGRGDSDKMVSREETLIVQRRISGSSFFELPNTKHPIENVHPLLISTLIKVFAEKLKP